MKIKLFLQIIISLLSFLPSIRRVNIQQESNTKLSFRRRPESSIFLSLRETARLAAIFLFSLTLPSLAFAQEKIPVFPTTPVEVYTIYTSLAVFWLAIIGLIVVIKMKLNEIERIQKLGIDKEDREAPMLE